MEAKIILPRDLCEQEAVRFVARRYGTTPERVIERFLVQAGIIRRDELNAVPAYDLAPNELALFRDLGVQPSEVEIK